MRRAIVTTTATAAGVVLLLSLKPHGAQNTSAQAPVISSGSDAGSSTTGSAPTAAPSTGSTGPTGSTGSKSTSTKPSTKATTKSSNQAATKSAPTTASYTGQAVDTRYGPVQVRIDVSNGKISKVDVLQYPSGSQRDADINGYALPVLNQEALSAQNAQIDMVSGATYTSNGYVQSLQSALDQAGLK